jgi:hypothetical protein
MGGVTPSTLFLFPFFPGASEEGAGLLLRSTKVPWAKVWDHDMGQASAHALDP